MSKAKKPAITGATALALRKRLHLNQSEFWARLGVTQSGGCRYERGRPIPRPVQRLYYLTYICGILPVALGSTEQKAFATI